MSDPSSDAIDDAIETVAAEIAARLVGWADWGDYPEISEGDWARVVAAMEAHSPEVPVDEYEAAYELLAAGADQ